MTYNSYMPKRYRRALVVGRFQPFHRGHLYLIRTALEQADMIVIGIGSANVRDADNPYDAKSRQEIVARAMEHEGIAHRIDSIVPIDDTPDDGEWLSLAIDRVGEIDLVIGNNEWVNGIFEKAGYRVMRIPLYKREIYEGKKIRARLRKQKDL